MIFNNGARRIPPRVRVRGAAAPTLAGVLAGALVLLAGCSTKSNAGTSENGPLKVVAAENIWGDLAKHVGGNDVQVRNIINSPDADPHDYEPTAADGRDIAGAQLVIVNGIGYDSWASKLVQANSVPGDRVLNVGDTVGVKEGGNPHRWYAPADVSTVLDTIVTDLSRLDPAHAADYQTNAAGYRSSDLARYHDLIASIKRTCAGTPIGASESIVSPMAEALGLVVKTPASFLSAISEGAEPTVADKNTIDAQLKEKQIKVYVFNSQNATPDVSAQVKLARSEKIPVVTFTETLTPAGSSFVDWQVRQLEQLRTALASVTSP
jgi:zinc/manganese transport system substrate-binding protein